jgi:hypothetical protein
VLLSGQNAGSFGGRRWSAGTVLRLRSGGVLFEVVGCLGSHKPSWTVAPLPNHRIEAGQEQLPPEGRCSADVALWLSGLKSNKEKDISHILGLNLHQCCVLAPLFLMIRGSSLFHNPARIRSNTDRTRSSCSRPCMTRKLESKIQEPTARQRLFSSSIVSIIRTSQPHGLKLIGLPLLRRIFQSLALKHSTPSTLRHASTT